MRAAQPTKPGDQAESRGIFLLLSLPLILYVFFRKLLHLLGTNAFLPALFLLLAFTLLYLLSIQSLTRFLRYHTLYFLIQFMIIEALGLLTPYEDTWGFLYIILAIQLQRLPDRRESTAWGVVFTAALLVTMIATRGLLDGLGYSLLIVSLAVFFASYYRLYTQAEAAEGESKKLLEDLRAAHGKLKDYASQAEALAAAQERDRLIRELHDSVSQMIFSISLATESTRSLLAKDPSRIPAALERLQELTAAALARMRALIVQWRPSED
jgi:signal transduction histidine kinase